MLSTGRRNSRLARPAKPDKEEDSPQKEEEPAEKKKTRK